VKPRLWLTRLFLLAVPALCSSAWADGKVFARVASTSVTTPDQQALLYFSNGVERLVIETSFIGHGTNFAWVIPLPSTPRIEAASTNFFRTLNISYQPRLISKASNGWIIYSFCGFFIAGILWGYQRNKLGRVAAWLVFLTLALLFAMLPNFVLVRGLMSVSTASSVTVLDRRTVGVYDTVTLSSRDGRALLDWLNLHGFYTSTNALPVISSYATHGWVFATARINRDSTALTRSKPHPLVFTFASEKPVYPLRLTGVENDKCEIELFVFGPGRAEATGFQVEHCGKPSYADDAAIEFSSTDKEFFAPSDPGEYRIANKEIRGVAMPAAVTTKLVATLSSRDMQSDALIDWIPFQRAIPTLYSRDAAVAASLDWFVGIAVIGALLLQLLSPNFNRRACWRAGLIVVVAAAVCGFLRLGTARLAEVQFIPGGWLAARNNFRALDAAIQQYGLERKNPAPLTFGELQAALTNYLRSVENTFEKEPLRNQATPGNLTLQQNTNGMDVIWYDINGGAHVIATFEQPRPPAR
jgi:hypothetical protein